MRSASFLPVPELNSYWQRMFKIIPLVFFPCSPQVTILTPCSRDMCSHDQKDKFICGSTQVFATASVVVSKISTLVVE